MIFNFSNLRDLHASQEEDTRQPNLLCGADMQTPDSRKWYQKDRNVCCKLHRRFKEVEDVFVDTVTSDVYIPERPDRRTCIDANDCSRNAKAPHNPPSDVRYYTHASSGEYSNVKQK